MCYGLRRLLYSKDLLKWSFITTKYLPFEKERTILSVINDSLYYLGMAGNIIYKSDDPIIGKWQIYNGSFTLAVGDPDMFQNTDGKGYMYFGYTSDNYLQAVELDANNKPNPMKKPVNILIGTLHFMVGKDGVITIR